MPDEQDIFYEALQRTDAEARRAYLDQACESDPALRARIEKLLAAHEKTAGFLKSPAETIALDNPSIHEGVGSVIGPYKLRQVIGEGGFGVVYLAEQKEPVKRNVALKIIKPGMDSKAVIQRFETERQALALMEHPNIARVLDGGTTPTGRPFFVMEQVKGIPITKYCDEERLNLQERMELFIPVCRAVQHAHQKGIIHRDLKPGNVLVALFDGKPAVKVIDFGVAKATHANLTEGTMYTGLGQMIGTLEYMAPEQAELNNLDIDTRADIYSLGVLLYELMTGSPPFSEKELLASGYDAMLKVIREKEPEHLDTRLSHSDELPNIAAARHIEPARLTRLLHQEPDWIVMKCLEKERGRRYDTANALAMDIQRYLNGEAIMAGPISRVYKFRKFIRRNRGPMVAASMVFLALVGGMTASLLGYAEATQQAAHANRRLELAQQAVDDYLVRVTDNKQLKDNAAFKELRKQLLESAIPFYESLIEEEPDAPDLRAERGRAYTKLAGLRWRLGQMDRAMVDIRQAETILLQLVHEHPSVPRYELMLANNSMAAADLYSWNWQLDEAENAYFNALEIFRRHARTDGVCAVYEGLSIHLRVKRGDLAAARKLLEELINIRQSRGESAELGDAYVELGMNLQASGRWNEAEEMYGQALRMNQESENFIGIGDVYLELGNLATARGDCDTAEAMARKALGYYEQPGHLPGMANCYHNIGVAYFERGEWEQAETEFRKSLRIHEQIGDLRDIVRNCRYLARVLRRTGDKQGAEAMIQKAVATIEQIEDEREMGGLYNDLGILLRREGDLEGAERMYHKAIEHYENVDYYGGLANVYMNLGLVFNQRNETSAAEEMWDKAGDIFRRQGNMRGLADYYNDIGTMRANLFSRLGKHKEAEAFVRAGLDIQSKLAADFPNVPTYRQQLATSHNRLGNMSNQLGKRAQALAAYQAGLDIRARLVSDYPDVPEHRYKLAGSLTNLGSVLNQLGQRAKAEAAYRTALKILDKLVAEFPATRRRYRQRLGKCLYNVANLLSVAPARSAEAEAAYGDALTIQDKLTSEFPTVPNYQSELAATLHNQGLRLANAGKLAESRQAFERAIRHQSKALEYDPGHPTYRRFLRNHYWGFASVLTELRDHAAAFEASVALARHAYDLPIDLYNAACFVSLSVPLAEQDEHLPQTDRDGLARKYADRALELLRDAVAKGFDDPVHMKHDPDLDALRDREDFKALIAELEAKSQLQESGSE